jgi:uncharacterized protein YbbK (DUF523 family)
MMSKILVSACLLGEPVRYNGSDLRVEDAILHKWSSDGRVIACCPEVCGGLPVPRPPAEIVGGDGAAVLDGKAAVVDREGKDVSRSFITGAEQALSLCRKHRIKTAILTENSPSCGHSMIYDGRFSGRKIPGAGVTAVLLEKNGVRVFNQHEIEKAAIFLNRIRSDESNDNDGYNG